MYLQSNARMDHCVSDVSNITPVNLSSNSLHSMVSYGQRLLASVLDGKATSEPQGVCCSLPYDDNELSKGYEDITYLKFANAVNMMAWFIHENFGPSSDFDTIVYLGTPDIRYQIIEVAVIKTGYKVLFSSHMNSLAGHLTLIDETNAKIMLSTSEVKTDDILAAKSMRHEVIPELDDILNASSVKNYPYHKTFREAKDDPFLILHTSGTTGIPKPVEHTLGSISTIDHRSSLPDNDSASGYPIRHFWSSLRTSTRMLVPFLPFHAVVSAVTMAGMVFGNLIWIPGFRHKMTTTHDLPRVLKHCKADTAYFSPAMVEDLARHPDIGQCLLGIKKCLYGGAAVTEIAGEIFSRYTHLQGQWGMTEIINLVNLELAPEDFAYCGWDLIASGLSFEQVAEDLYEIIVRRTNDSYPNVAIFWRHPDLEIFRPGDLWSPHPDPKKAKYAWKFQGRADDLISWKDGTNFNPTGYEKKHSEHKDVRSAVIAGTGHLQPVLLLELYQPQRDQEIITAVLDKIWKEGVTPVNQIAPTNGKVAKTHIIIATPDNPFERNVKGTVARKATLRKYESEIESVYRRFGDNAVSLSGRFGDNHAYTLDDEIHHNDPANLHGN